MRRNLEKAEVSVVVLLPVAIYDIYAETLNERGLKRQKHSSELFQNAVEQDIANHIADTKKATKRKAG